MLEIVRPAQSRFELSTASPFNLTEALSVTEWKGFVVGMTVDINIARGTALGEIHAIWLGAKTHNDERVIAFEVYVGTTPYYLTHRGVHHVVGEDDFVHRIH